MFAPVNVIFVVPFMLESSLRFARAAARLSGVRIGILSQDPAHRLPEDLKGLVNTFRQVSNAMETEPLVEGVRAIATEWNGRVDRVMGILEQLQGPLAEVRERLQIRGMDANEALHFRDKSVMKARLREHQLPCAASVLATSPREALAFADRIGLPLVAKPPAGAGSRNTFRVENRAELEAHLAQQPPSAKAPLMLEEFIQGEEYSFDTVTLHGKHLFHSISRYRPGPLEVMASPWIQWTVQLPRDISGPQFDAIKQAGPTALDVLGIYTGLTHMEWFRKPGGGIAISEVAARPPGAQFTSLLSWAHDLDFYTAWARLIIFEEFKAPERLYSAGGAYLRGQGRGKVKAVHGWEQLQRDLGPLVVEAKIPQPGQPASTSYDGEGHILVRHPDTQVVADALSAIISKVRVELV